MVDFTCLGTGNIARLFIKCFREPKRSKHFNQTTVNPQLSITPTEMEYWLYRLLIINFIKEPLTVQKSLKFPPKSRDLKVNQELGTI